MIQMASCRYMADWLAGDVGGGVMRVNSMLTAVPRFPGDAEPDPFAIVTGTYNPGDNDSMRAAEAKDWPARYPALYVTPEGPVPMEGEVSVNVRDAILAVGIRIYQRMSDFAKAAQRAAYYAKAVERTLMPFFAETAEGRTARGEDHASGIYIIGCVGDAKARNEEKLYSWILDEWDQRQGDNISEQRIYLNLQVRDFTP